MESQKIFLKGKKYIVNEGLMQSECIILCTETTCSLSSKSFKGVSIKNGEYSKDWSTVTFKELTSNKNKSCQQ